MTKQPETNGEAATNDLVITRLFRAPRALVFKAWTDADLLKQWWGPKDFTTPVYQADFRVGGKYLFCMRGPDGKEFWTTGVYREIIPPERIVYTDSFADAQGNVVPASYYNMSGDMPLELLVTLTFEEPEPGQTKLTLRHAGLPASQMKDMTGSGWNEMLDKLETVVANS